ncbi:MAG: hypothetical protein QM692_01655 [Thermomicrobiales bacterium]
MDGAAFDEMVQRLTRPAGRRALLAGLAVAGVAGGLARDAATAKKKKKPKKVTICRNGQTLSVTKKKKNKHLQPGDTTGACKATTRPPSTSTTQPPRCPAAKPNFCARLDTCQAACGAGHAFDAESCACVCSPATTCCICDQGGGNALFFSGIATEADCTQQCTGASATLKEFKGGEGKAFTFNLSNDTCVVACTTEPMTCPANVDPPTCSDGTNCCAEDEDGGCCPVDTPNCCPTFCCGKGFSVCCGSGGCCTSTFSVCCGTVCCPTGQTCCNTNGDCSNGQVCSLLDGASDGCCADPPERGRSHRAPAATPMARGVPRG